MIEIKCRFTGRVWYDVGDRAVTIRRRAADGEVQPLPAQPEKEGRDAE